MFAFSHFFVVPLKAFIKPLEAPQIKVKKKKKDIFLSSPVIRTGRVTPIYVVPSKSSKLFVEGSVH